MKTALCLLQIMLWAKLAVAFSLSGSAAVPSVTLQLTGVEKTSVTSNSGGIYQFNNLPAGVYTVTPSLHGYVFSPTSRTVDITSASLKSVDFQATAVSETSLAATPASFSLTSKGATEQLQVEATYSNGSTQTVTANATYASSNTSIASVSQTGLVTAIASGTATIVASYGGKSSSASVTVKIVAGTYSISGTARAASVTVKLSGVSSATTTSSSTGSYSFSSLAPGAYVITPELSGYTFTPSNGYVTLSNANVGSVNFNVAVDGYSVELNWGAGTIKDPASGQVVAGYNVYRGAVSGGPYTKMNSSMVTGLSFTDKTVAAGGTYYYVCATVDNEGRVSGYSSQAMAKIP